MSVLQLSDSGAYVQSGEEKHTAFVRRPSRAHPTGAAKQRRAGSVDGSPPQA